MANAMDRRKNTVTANAARSPKKPAAFWMSLLALMIATFLAAMDTVSMILDVLDVC